MNRPYKVLSRGIIMISIEQCNTQLEKLNNINFDIEACDNRALALLAKMHTLQKAGDKEAMLGVCNEALSLAYGTHGKILDTAVCAFALSEISACMEGGAYLNEHAQMMADGIIRSHDDFGADENAAAASLLMALQNVHLPPFMRPAYIGHARIFALRAASGELSSMGQWLLKLALERLITARRKYQW